MELGYFLAKIVYMIVIYKTNVPINGLTPDEVLVFFGTYMPRNLRMERFTLGCSRRPPL